MLANSRSRQETSSLTKTHSIEQILVEKNHTTTETYPCSTSVSRCRSRLENDDVLTQHRKQGVTMPVVARSFRLS